MSIDLNWILSQPSDNYKTVTDLYLQLQLIKKITVNNFAEKGVFFKKDYSIKEYFSFIDNISIPTGKPKDSQAYSIQCFLEYYLSWSYRILGPWPINNLTSYYIEKMLEDIIYDNIGPAAVSISTAKKNNNFNIINLLTKTGPSAIPILTSLLSRDYSGEISLEVFNIIDSLFSYNKKTNPSYRASSGGATMKKEISSFSYFTLGGLEETKEVNIPLEKNDTLLVVMIYQNATNIGSWDWRSELIGYTPFFEDKSSSSVVKAYKINGQAGSNIFTFHANYTRGEIFFIALNSNNYSATTFTDYQKDGSKYLFEKGAENTIWIANSSQYRDNLTYKSEKDLDNYQPYYFSFLENKETYAQDTGAFLVIDMATSVQRTVLRTNVSSLIGNPLFVKITF